MRKYNWGIISTGVIAHKFASGLQVLPEAGLKGVASRSLDRAESFAEQFGFERAYGSYQELAEDPEIDVIYIGTPNPFHRENTLMCLEAGKAVLCEKPFAINAGESVEMIDRSREKQLFLMEAMWTRFIPVTRRVREWIADGKIGRIRMLEADFGYYEEVEADSRQLNPELGGGALLDVGIYPLSYASLLMGRAPAEITSLADIGETGVDEQSAYLLKYDQGELALLSSAVLTQTPHEARIIGTEGIIRVPLFYNPRTAVLLQAGEVVEEIHIPARANGYEYEAIEVMECLEAGKLESEVMPLDETQELMQTMDTIRKQWSMKYPME